MVNKTVGHGILSGSRSFATFGFPRIESSVKRPENNKASTTFPGSIVPGDEGAVVVVGAVAVVLVGAAVEVVAGAAAVVMRVVGASKIYMLPWVADTVQDVPCNPAVSCNF